MVINIVHLLLYILWRCGPAWAMVSSFITFLEHIRRTTVGKSLLDEWSVRRRNLYLTTHNIPKRQTSMPPRRDSNPQFQQEGGRRPTR